MWHPVLQNTDEPCPCCGKTWMELRAGKVTGSSIGKVMANYGKAFGDPAKRLAVEIAVVELGGTPEQDGYTNQHMERGYEQEPIARQLYEDEYFCDVQNGGFFEDGRTGASTDGQVGKNGIIEIKSVTKTPHYNCIEHRSYDPKYKWQYFFNLKVTQRDWVDFVSFCSTYPVGKRLYVVRINKKDVQKKFDQINIRLDEFFKLVETVKRKLRKF